MTAPLSGDDGGSRGRTGEGHCYQRHEPPGRDYLKVGQVMEILRQRGVRLIAINDGVDSLKGDDDFTPFRNIMNEFYARDTSRKIRSVFKSKA